MAINVKEIIADSLLELSMSKQLKQITIKDILKTTGISRQTFYNHFIDKNDLIQYIYDFKIVNDFHDKNLDLNFYQSLVASFKNMKKYQLFLKQACLLEGQNCLKDHIIEHCVQFDLKWHQKLYGNKPMPEALRFATIYHANASSAMTLSWILSDMSVSIEDMAKMITQMRGIGMEELFKDGDFKGNPYL